MMRPLHVSIAVAASAVLLTACDAHGHGESAAVRARESALARDLALAGDSGLARQLPGHDTGAVTDSPGMLESRSQAESLATDAALQASGATNASSHSAPAADGYVGASCASPAPDDQHRCLLGYLAKSDMLLDRYYQALILRLKNEAGVRENAPEPPSVQRLRSAQRAWLVYRDDECRRRMRASEGPLWAPVRAQCLAEYSALRAQELKDALARRRALAPLEKAKANRSSARTSTRPTRSPSR